MLINEVEYIVGISKKSIRYYEENGLLNPKRNSSNDYRIYDEDDIERLKKIKFLRELGVPIRDLKMLHNKEITLSECMQDRIYKIDKEKSKYEQAKQMCEEILNNKDEYDFIDITKYFHNINILKKEGFTMKNINRSRKKKIIEAIISSAIFSLIFIFFIWLFTYLQMTEVEKIPWALYVFLILLFGLPIIGIVVNLITRIKEINGGEEDEASKY